MEKKYKKEKKFNSIKKNQFNKSDIIQLSKIHHLSGVKGIELI